MRCVAYTYVKGLFTNCLIYYGLNKSAPTLVFIAKYIEPKPGEVKKEPEAEESLGAKGSYHGAIFCAGVIYTCTTHVWEHVALNIQMLPESIGPRNMNWSHIFISRIGPWFSQYIEFEDGRVEVQKANLISTILPR